MGPITLYDVVGLDVAVHAGRTMLEAFPDRVVPAEILQKLFDRGRLGQKVGRGFFDYGPAKGGKPPRGTDSEEVAQLIDECRTGDAAKVQARGDHRPACSCRCCSKRRACSKTASSRDVRDVDLALIFGIGFPPFKGGLFFWADQVGAAKNPRKTQALRRARQTLRTDRAAHQTRQTGASSTIKIDGQEDTGRTGFMHSLHPASCNSVHP